MNVPIMLRRLIQFYLCLIVVLGSFAAQSGNGSNQGCMFAQAYRDRGWEIPGRHGAKLGLRMNVRIDGKGTDMWLTRLVPPVQPVTLLLPFCSRSGDGTIDLSTRPVHVQEVWQFDVKEHVFAIGVRAAWVAPSKSGPTVDIGTASEILYSDDRGDGVFRIMKYSSYPFVPSIPEWLNTLSER